MTQPDDKGAPKTDTGEEESPDRVGAPSAPVDSEATGQQEFPTSGLVLPPKGEWTFPREAPLKPMSELEREGAELAHFVLCLIAGLAVLLLLMAAWSELHDALPEALALQKIVNSVAASSAASAPSDEALTKVAVLADKIAEARRGSRDFWKALIQLILLNLLLPVLTAILGYIFGTVKSDR